VVITAEFEALKKENCKVDLAEYFEVAVLNCIYIVVKTAEMAMLLMTT
jgi:hypothetical protein